MIMDKCIYEYIMWLGNYDDTFSKMRTVGGGIVACYIFFTERSAMYDKV